MSPFDIQILEKVLYRCSCGSRKPISSLYFCRHCLDLRCGFCVSHEVDSHYCPNCMENMPSAEARLKKNRCANCFDCPHCGHTLSTRASSVSVPSPDDPTKMTAKKVYYLACAFCRWTSRDIGLPDQSVASGSWPEQTNPYADRIGTLQEHYRTIAQREKMEKESRRFLGRKLSYLHLSDKYGLSSVAARKRSGLSSLALGTGLTGGREDVGRQVDVAPATAISLSEVSDLPTQLLTDPLDLYNVTNLEQRFGQVEFQPVNLNNIYPTHKHLMIKRSQRCRRCEHNLSKPEYNPTSIKFKIQLAAYYHVPEIIIFKVDKLVKGTVSNFVIKVVNPTNSGSVLQLITLDQFIQIKDEEEKEKKEKGDTDDKNVSAINPLRQPSIVEATDQKMDIGTGQVFLPKSKVYLPPRDDAAEFDEGGVDLAGHVDDRDVVVWRKSNKVGIQLKVKPDSENVVVAFAIQYQYTNTIFAHDSKKEVRTANISVPVFLSLGSTS